MKLEKDLEVCNIARNAIATLGDIYLKERGVEKVTSDVSQLREYVRSYSKIMGIAIPFNVATIDSMQMLLSRLPLDCGMDILTRQSFVQLQSMLSAIRKKMLVDRDSMLKTTSPELFTPGADERKAS